MTRHGAINTNIETVSLVAGYPELVVFSATSIDAATIGNTSLGTTNASKNFFPIMCLFRVRSATLISVAPTLSIGTNSPTYDNIGTSLALTGLGAVNGLIRQDIGTTATSTIAAGTQIFSRVSISAVATAMTIDVHLIGYYL